MGNVKTLSMEPPNSSISSAVAIAGRLKEDASLRWVKFIRLNEQRAIESYDVDLQDLKVIRQIQAKDLVVVPEKNSSSTLGWVRRILSPFGA